MPHSQNTNLFLQPVVKFNQNDDDGRTRGVGAGWGTHQTRPDSRQIGATTVFSLI